MRVLLATQYFSPEITAAPLRLEPFARGLAAAGHEVTVVCQIPNHPHGEIPAAYRGRPVMRSTVDGYRVVRVRASISRTPRAASRLASYATYAAAAVTAGAGLRRQDVVVASSPPLSVGLVGEALAVRHRAPLVFDVRDLWPEAAVALGELGEGSVLAAAEAIERRLYRRAAAVTTPTAPFGAHIRAKGAERVEIVPNGTTPEWIARGEREPDRAAAGLPAEGFVWCYGGNIGLSQNLGAAVEAAGILGDGFVLMLLGDGTGRARLELEAAEQVRAGRVIFRDSVPPGEAAQIMRASDALLVSLANDPALGKSVPVKLYDSSALGRPVVVAAPGEARRLVEAAGSALVVEPGRPDELAAAVRGLAGDPAMATRLGASARDFAQANLRSVGVDSLEGLLSELAKEGRR